MIIGAGEEVQCSSPAALWSRVGRPSNASVTPLAEVLYMSAPSSPLSLPQQYNPELDREQFEAEIKQYALTTNSAGVGQMKRMSLADPEIMHMADKASHMTDA